MNELINALVDEFHIIHIENTNEIIVDYHIKDDVFKYINEYNNIQSCMFIQNEFGTDQSIPVNKHTIHMLTCSGIPIQDIADKYFRAFEN